MDNRSSLFTFAVMFRAFIILLVLTPFLLHASSPSMSVPLAPYFQLDTYYSFIGNKSADVWGFKAGVSYKKKWRIAFGYNKIKADIIEKVVLPKSEWNNTYHIDHQVLAQLYLRYYPLMAEYIFYDKDAWQLSVPMSLGYGKSYFQYYDKSNHPRSIYNHGVLVHDVGLNASYKIIKWVGIGAGVGIRLMLISNPEVDTNFNSPMFSFRVKLYLGEIAKSLFPESKFIKKYNN